MSAGYLYKGVCYMTPNDVIGAAQSQYPQQQGTNLMYLKTPPVFDSASNTLSLDVWSGTTNTSDAAMIVLQICDTNNVPTDPSFMVAVFIGCAIMFALGFIGTR